MDLVKGCWLGSLYSKLWNVCSGFTMHFITVVLGQTRLRLVNIQRYAYKGRLEGELGKKKSQENE